MEFLLAVLSLVEHHSGFGESTASDITSAPPHRSVGWRNKHKHLDENWRGDGDQGLEFARVDALTPGGVGSGCGVTAGGEQDVGVAGEEGGVRMMSCGGTTSGCVIQ